MHWHGCKQGTRGRSKAHLPPAPQYFSRWYSSQQRGEGSGETLEKPSSTRRGLQESWRETFYKGIE